MPENGTVITTDKAGGSIQPESGGSLVIYRQGVVTGRDPVDGDTVCFSRSGDTVTSVRVGSCSVALADHFSETFFSALPGSAKVTDEARQEVDRVAARRVEHIMAPLPGTENDTELENARIQFEEAAMRLMALEAVGSRGVTPARVRSAARRSEAPFGRKPVRRGRPLT